MLVRRAAIARLAADAAGVTEGDRVVDVGCGPGGAVREAARRGASVTGVDPAPLMLRLGRYLTRGPLRERVTFRPGSAEQIPLPGESVSVAWSISSAHHWSDLPGGLREMYRVLAPDGRLVVAERLTRPGASGLAAHGATEAQADEIMAQARAAGFADVGREVRAAGRRTMVLIRGVKVALAA